MSTREIKLYSSEFKESAIKLALEGEKPIAQTASDLGIKKSTLYTWISKYADPKALIEKSGNNDHIYDENKRLKKELAKVAIELTDEVMAIINKEYVPKSEVAELKAENEKLKESLSGDRIEMAILKAENEKLKTRIEQSKILANEFCNAIGYEPQQPSEAENEN